MFEGLSGGAQTDLLSDVTIDKIDYEWVEATKKISHLKKALRLLEEDGDYFPELKKAVVQRIQTIDPKQVPKTFNNEVDFETKKNLEKEIHNWEDENHKRTQIKEDKKKQQVFEIDSTEDQEIIEMNKRKAENEKNKGNEAIRSKDYDEALQYYTKSIEYNPQLAASYCNRALVYLKLEKYDECIKDCNKAIGLDPNYIKAYHRRGKANQAQKKYDLAYNDFRFIMDRQPENNEVNADLQDVIKLINKENPSDDKGFKRVQIIEDDDEDDSDSEQENGEQQQGDENNGIPVKEFQQRIKRIEENKEKATALMKDGLFESALKILEKCVQDVEEMGPHNQDKEQVEYQTKRCSYINNMALCYKQTDHNKEVIQLTSKVIQNRHILDKNIMIKAYLRRAMSLEKLEKFRSSKIDYQKVKELDPGNLQASQGLSRVIPHQGEESEKNILQKEEIQQDLERAQKLEKQNQVEIQEEEQEKESSQQQTQQEQEQKQPEQQQQQKEQQQVQQEQKKEGVELKELEGKKNAANELFKKKDVEGALEQFNQGVSVFESQYRKLIKKEGEEQKLYIQFMTNKALCELRLKKFENVVKTTDKVLSIQPDNAKAIYRNALGSKSLGDAIIQEQGDEISLDNLKRVSQYYESSRKEFERLQKIEASNSQVQVELQEIVKKSVQIKLRVREKDTLQQQQQKQQQEQEKKEQEKEKKVQQVQQESNNNKTVNKEFINEVSRNAMDSMILELIEGDSLPDNSTAFEKNLTSFKKQPEKLFLYLQKFQEANFVQIYKKRDLPPDNLIQIVRAIKNQGIESDLEKCKELMVGLSKTNKFNLCVMCLSKKEKQEIKDVLERIKAEKELYTAYKL